MPKLNRRNFLQMVSAAGLAPALPAFASTSAATSGGMTTAQMLWVSMYKRAEAASDLGGMARSMGISREAAQGVYTRLLQTQALTAQSVGQLHRAAEHGPVSTNTPSITQTSKPNSLRPKFEKLMRDEDRENPLDQAEAEAEELENFEDQDASDPIT